MKLFLTLVACLLATLTPPAHALLGAKLALLGLGGNLLGGGSSGGSGGRGYGSGGYGSGNYNGGYYAQQNRPVYSGDYSNGYGGGYNYGAGYSGGGYSNGGYSNGGGETVKVIKVIFDNQNAGISSNYANGYSSGYSNAGWTPILAPVQTTYVAAPAARPIVQVIPAPQPIQYSALGSAQTYQYSGADQNLVSVQSSPESSLASSAPASSQVSVNLQPPAQQSTVSQLTPQPIFQSISAPAQSAQVVKTVKLIVESDNNEGGYNGVPSQNYGPPPPQYNGGYGGSWGGSASSSSGWNNGYKSGGIWEKLGC
ncbi:uncharacterized protein [Eurosta solidaginis]|uniref:uncharacterized protein n=1 Tax=Eurosta solidaginis TaxID=178769 RepID=UPI003530EB75